MDCTCRRYLKYEGEALIASIMANAAQNNLLTTFP